MADAPKSGASDPLEAAYAACTGIVRSHDRDRFLCTLFAPAKARPHLAALYAFDIETGRIPAMVSESMPGEIRLQWWRDALSGIAHGDLSGAPVVTALQHTLASHGLASDPLVRLTEARIFDLYDDRMPDMDALEAHAGETDATLLQMAATIVAGEAVPELSDVSGHGGVARVILQGMRRFAASGFRDARLIPTALSVDSELVLDVEGALPPQALDLWQSLADVGLDHLNKAQAALKAAPAVSDPVFLPLTLTGRDFVRFARSGPNGALESGPLVRQWHVWRAASRGGFRAVRP